LRRKIERFHRGPIRLNSPRISAEYVQQEYAMAKIGAVFLMAYLLFGTVMEDYTIHGPTTAGCGTRLMLGAAILVLFFLIGVRATLRYSRFMGFSRWQWAALPPLALAVGMTLRFYAL
jgi:hypothetical protein